MKRALVLFALILVTFGAVAASAGETKPATVTLSITGMHCGGCASGITAMLKRTAGVIKADVSFEKKSATVDYDAGKTTPAKIVETVEKMGFKVAVKTK